MVNRGFAVYGDRLFMATLDAHFVALEMKTGKVDLGRRDRRLPGTAIASTGAPLVVKDKVIVGIAGGEFANPRLPRRVQPDDRQARVALLDDSGARRTGQRYVAGRDLAARRRADLADRAPTIRRSTSLYWGTGNPNPDWDGDEPPGRQPVYRTRSSRSIRTPAS